MRFRYFLLVIILVLFSLDNVNAVVCDSNDIVRLKELAQNVDVSYQYVNNVEDEAENNQVDNLDEFDGIVSNDIYNVQISNITDEIYIKDTNYNEYRLNDAVDGILHFTTNSGTVTYYVYSSNCLDKLLRTITLQLDKYNIYADSKECEGISAEELAVCDKWYQGDLSYSQFIKKIDEYNLEHSTDNFSRKYIYIVIGGGIVVAVVVWFIIRRKRSVLE